MTAKEHGLKRVSHTKKGAGIKFLVCLFRMLFLAGILSLHLACVHCLTLHFCIPLVYLENVFMLMASWSKSKIVGTFLSCPEKLVISEDVGNVTIICTRFGDIRIQSKIRVTSPSTDSAEATGCHTLIGTLLCIITLILDFCYRLCSG